MLEMFRIALISVLGLATLGWLVSLIAHDSSIADVLWGLYFIIIAVILRVTNSQVDVAQTIEVILVGVWGVRLSVHIGKRKLGKPEDWRYVNWRKQWGKSFVVRSYVQNFIFQALLALCISTSTIVIAHATGYNGGSLKWWQFFAVIIWAGGFYFEVVSDWQLSKFLASSHPKGSIMMSGLWSRSRHPNYFGEIMQWWAIFIFCIGMPYWFVALISPVLITFLIRFVSGVPLLEKRYANNMTYQNYADITPVLIPKVIVKE